MPRAKCVLGGHLIERNDVETAGLLFGEPLLTAYGTVSSLTLDCYTAPGKVPDPPHDKCALRSRIESIDGPASG